MWQIAAFLRSKGQILWNVTVNTTYVHPINFLALGSRDMHDANNKAIDFLFCALCQSEFDRVQTKDLACRIWSQLKDAHVGNAQVQAWMYATFWREYENFTHLPSESIDALFQWSTVMVNNMRANVDVLPYDDHDRAVKLLHSLDHTIWDVKLEAIVESEKYDTLTVNELFSKLKSTEVDRGMTAKLESMTTKEWANKDRYHPSNGVPEPRMKMPRAKAIVRTILAWGDRKVAGGVAGRGPPVGLVRVTGQTGASLGGWQFGFCAREDARFGSFGCGTGGLHGESCGGQFARRSPPCAQYDGGRSRSFELGRRNEPQSSFCGFRSPPTRQGWFPSGGSRGGFRGGSLDRCDDMVCANPILEQMAWHWFYSFGINPSAELFVRSHARF
jgi:hypothetical protein